MLGSVVGLLNLGTSSVPLPVLSGKSKTTKSHHYLCERAWSERSRNANQKRVLSLTCFVFFRVEDG